MGTPQTDAGDAGAGSQGARSEVELLEYDGYWIRRVSVSRNHDVNQPCPRQAARQRAEVDLV